MTFILKVMHTDSLSPVTTDSEFGLYADIVSVNFSRHPDGSATAHCYLREPVKTAEVLGFCEVEKFVSFRGPAYVMNENGKTVGAFDARTSSDAPSGLGGSRAQPSDNFLGHLPYETAAAIRRAARTAGDLSLLARLDHERVAEDA